MRPRLIKVAYVKASFPPHIIAPFISCKYMEIKKNVKIAWVRFYVDQLTGENLTRTIWIFNEFVSLFDFFF